MKKLALFACLCITLMANAQREKAEAYIQTFKETAITEMLRTGVPASITLAQGILESQFGESDLVKSSNNHFGIKCKTEWTGPRIYHDDDEKGECFRVYATAEESYRDHSDFLKQRSHYAFLFKLNPTDFEGWARGLRKAGYATNPAYPQQLLKVFNDYNLQQYSLLALARQKNESPADSMSAPALNSTEPAVPTDLSQDEKQTAGKEVETRVPMAMYQPPMASRMEMPAMAEAKTKVSKPYPSGIFTINHTRVVYETAGTSLLSVAIKYDIPLSKLLEYNELTEMDLLDKDQLVFIEKKQKKGATDFHLAAAGETLHSISQQEGVRLESILEYNNYKKGTVVSPAGKVYLRQAATAAAVVKPASSHK